MMGRQTGDQSQFFYLFNLEDRYPISAVSILKTGSRPFARARASLK